MTRPQANAWLTSARTTKRPASRPAQLIKEALPNGGKIMLFVGHSDSQNAVERSGGIKKALAGSNIEIIDIRTDDTDAVRAQKNAEDTLVKYPDIACLVGLWNYNGPAIFNAVRGAGKTGTVKIVCFDDEADTLAGIASGDIYGTVVQNPFEFGKAIRHPHGKISQRRQDAVDRERFSFRRGTSKRTTSPTIRRK